MQANNPRTENNRDFIHKITAMMFDENRFQEAAVILEKKLKLTTQPKFTQSCLYYLGKCYFSLQKYSEVIRAYLEFKLYGGVHLKANMYAAVGCKIKEISDLLKTQDFTGKKEELDEISLLLDCEVDQINDKLLDLALSILIPASKNTVDIKPEWSHCVIGDIYLQKNKLNKARFYYEEGLKFKADDFYLRKSLGDYFLKKENTTRAETEYNLALKYFDQEVKGLADNKRVLVQKVKDEAEASLKIIRGD